MSREDWVLILAIVLLFLGLRFRERVTSTIRYQPPAEPPSMPPAKTGPPPWPGQIGDVVEYGGRWWGWTELGPTRGWVEIEPGV
jgi:hypothetical protein